MLYFSSYCNISCREYGFDEISPLEIKNTIKMTAIVTLMGVNDSLEALRRLLVKLWKYFICDVSKFLSN